MKVELVIGERRLRQLYPYSATEVAGFYRRRWL